MHFSLAHVWWTFLRTDMMDTISLPLSQHPNANQLKNTRISRTSRPKSTFLASHALAFDFIRAVLRTGIVIQTQHQMVCVCPGL
eukprot:m.309171 g.309171  ORF g.309171 m.309171 type:complete len:84 (+) comp15945_c0_seq5:1789-2040(+)